MHSDTNVHAFHTDQIIYIDIVENKMYMHMLDKYNNQIWKIREKK